MMPTYYFYRLKRDDYVREFCVANARDPHQSVSTFAPDGTVQFWPAHADGDLLVFTPPDGYAGDQGLLWCYDRRFQLGEAMPYEELERRALNERKSLVVQ